MDGWTVIPPWLYQNDLSDLELQTVYVRQAEAKLRECAAETAALEDDVRGLEQYFKRPLTAEERAAARDELGELAVRLRGARAVEAAAAQFLADARAALRKYQAQATPAALPKPVSGSRRRALPRGTTDG